MFKNPVIWSSKKKCDLIQHTLKAKLIMKCRFEIFFCTFSNLKKKFQKVDYFFLKFQKVDYFFF